MMQERSAAITGAGNGIGRATAARLAGLRYRLALVDRDAAGLEETRDQCVRAGAQAHAFVCDVTDDRAVSASYASILARFGRVDLLVLGAGVGRYAPFLELGLDEWRRMLDVNLMGVVRFARAALPGMIEQGGGHIVVIGSRRGLEPTSHTSAYSSTKAALHGLARSLSAEVSAHGVHVCLLCPGGVRSNFRNVPGEQKDERFLEPAVIADAIAFIAGNPDNAWVRQLEILPLGL